MKKTIIGVAIILVIGLGAYYVLSGKNYNQGPAATPAVGTPIASSPAASGQGMSVNIKNFAFEPAALNVKVGTTVTWTNNDSVAHTVTSDSGNLLNSPTLSPGESFSFTFTSAGSVAYHCNIHQTMKGVVVVGN
jgi:plastocyanin